MVPKSYISEGFILGRRNYGEADRILIVFSKDKGNIHLLAKGIRRPKSKKRGHLEIFSKIKFQATSHSGIGILTEVETIDDYNQIRRSIRKVSLAYYFMEIIGKALHEGDVNMDVYNLISEYMQRLKKESKLKEFRLEFVSNILKILGYWPKNKELENPDKKMEEVLERQINSERVGKIMLE